MDNVNQIIDCLFRSYLTMVKLGENHQGMILCEKQNPTKKERTSPKQDKLGAFGSMTFEDGYQNPPPLDETDPRHDSIEFQRTMRMTNTPYLLNRCKNFVSLYYYVLSVKHNSDMKL